MNIVKPGEVMVAGYDEFILECEYKKYGIKHGREPEIGREIYIPCDFCREVWERGDK